MGYDGSLKFDTKIDTSGFDSGVSKLSGAAQKGLSVASGLITGIAGAVGTGVAASIKVGASFESQMSKVSAISGATGSELEALSNKAKEMGAKTKFSATESGQAMEYMAMAGWKSKDMLSGIEGIMNLAAASGEDLATTSDIVTDALTGFGLSAKDSTHFADVLAQASSNANTNVSMMGETFKYVAPVAGALGFSAEDTSVAIGLMANSGIKASQAGTSLRSMMSRMSAPTKQVSAAMEKVGVSITDSHGKMKSLDTIMGDLRKGFSGLSKAEQSQVASAIAGQEGMSGLLAIVNASDADFNKLKDSIYNCDGASAKMAETMQDNLQGQLTIAKSAAEALGLEVYESIQKPLTNLAKQGISALDQLTEAFKKDGTTGLIEAGSGLVANLVTGIAQAAPQAVSGAIAIIGALAGSFSKATPQLVGAAGNIVTALAQGLTAVLPTIGQLGMQLITQIGNSITQSAPTLVPKAIELLAQFALGLISALPQLITVGIQMITSLAQGLINSIPLLISYVPQIINSFCAAIDTGLLQLIAAGVKIIANLVIGIVQAIPQLIAALPQIVLAIYNVFMHINLLSAGANIIKTLASGLKSSGGSVISAAQNIVKFIWNQLVKTDWVNLGKMLIQKLVSGIRGMGGSAGSVARSIGQKIFTTISNVNWLSLGKTVISKLISGLLSLLGRMGSAAKSLGTKAVSAFKGINWGSVGSNIVKGIIGGVGAMAGSLLSKMQGLASSALKAAKKALGIKSPSRVFKKEVGKHIVTGIIAGIDTEQKNLKKTMESLCNTAVSSAKNASKKGNFEDIGKTFTDGLSSAIDTQVSKATTSGKNLINKEIKSGKNKDTDQYDKKIKDLNKKIKKAKKEKKSTKSLEKQLKQVRDKKKAVADTYSQLGKSMITAYSNAVKQQGQQIISQAEKEIEELSAAYQEKYNSLIQQRSDMISKLRSTGSLYDLDGDLEAIKNYQNRIKALKGKIPDTLMQQILGMDVASANDYMEYLQSLDPDKYQDYINKWNEIYNGSESFGNDFFQSDLNNLENTYETELTGRLNDLSKKINQIGQNTMKGFISGMKSQTKGMTKAVNSMCDQLIKSMRKKLKINSPSRVARDKVGKYMPLGLAAAFTKYMPEATTKIEKYIDVSIAAMRKKVESVEYPKPDTPNYNGPGGNKPVVIVQDNKPVEVNAEIHTTVDLDGKTVGKQITPYVNRNLGEEQTRAERRN